MVEILADDRITRMRVERLNSIAAEAKIAPLTGCAAVLARLLKKQSELSFKEYDFVNRAATLVTELYGLWDHGMSNIWDVGQKLDNVHRILIRLQLQFERDERGPEIVRRLFSRDPDMSVIRRLEEDMYSVIQSRSGELQEHINRQLRAIAEVVLNDRDPEVATLNSGLKEKQERLQRLKEEATQMSKESRDRRDEELSRDIAREEEERFREEERMKELAQKGREKEVKREEDDKRKQERIEEERRAQAECNRRRKERIEEEMKYQAKLDRRKREMDEELQRLTAQLDDVRGKIKVHIREFEDRKSNSSRNETSIHISTRPEQRSSPRPSTRRRRSVSVDLIDWDDSLPSARPRLGTRNPFHNGHFNVATRQPSFDDTISGIEYYQRLALRDFNPLGRRPVDIRSNNVVTANVSNSYNTTAVIHHSSRRR